MPKRTQLSEAEREQRRAADRAFVQQAVEQLRSSDGWQRWLATRRHFHSYSLRNQLLLAMQKPDATRVAGFKAWLALGYCVRRGEKALRIFAPCPPSKAKLQAWRDAGADPAEKPRTFFRLTAVFDRSQVDELPPPAEPAPLDPPAAAEIDGDELAPWLEPLTALAGEIGSTVAFESIASGADGYYRPKTKAIVVEAAHSPNRRVKTLVHELAHALVRADRQEEDPELDAAAEELVAETIAYSVCASSGIDPGEFSISYLAGWSEQHADRHDRGHRGADRPPLAPHRGRRRRGRARARGRRRARGGRVVSGPYDPPVALSRPHQNHEAGTPASQLVAAIEAVWAEIRRRHPEVPAVIVTVGAGSIGAPRGTLQARPLRRGALAPRRRPSAGASAPTAAVAELFVGGEGLAREPVDVLGTLLHEAAHGLAATREIKDTSRAGAYHNRRYKQLAEELGLTIERHPTIGWTTTTVPAATAAAYAREVEQLRAAIAHVRESEHDARRGGRAGTPSGDEPGESAGEDAGDGRSAPTYLCACQPPRRLRMAPTVYALAEVICGACEQPFSTRD